MKDLRNLRRQLRNTQFALEGALETSTALAKENVDLGAVNQLLARALTDLNWAMARVQGRIDEALVPPNFAVVEDQPSAIDALVKLFPDEEDFLRRAYAKDPDLAVDFYSDCHMWQAKLDGGTVSIVCKTPSQVYVEDSWPPDTAPRYLTLLEPTDLNPPQSSSPSPDDLP